MSKIFQNSRPKSINEITKIIISMGKKNLNCLLYHNFKYMPAVSLPYFSPTGMGAHLT